MNPSGVDYRSPARYIKTHLRRIKINPSDESILRAHSAVTANPLFRIMTYVLF